MWAGARTESKSPKKTFYIEYKMSVNYSQMLFNKAKIRIWSRVAHG